MKESKVTPELIRGYLHRFLLVCLLTTGFLLFGPSGLIQKLRLESLLEHHGSVISLVCLITSGYFFIAALSFVWGRIQNQIHNKQAQQLAQAKASCLDHEEKALLREFFLQRTRTLILPVQQDAVQRLLKHHILKPEEGTTDETHQKFSIAPCARRFITSTNLRLPVTELTEEDIRYFKAARPEYIKEQLKRQWREQLRAQRRQVA